jgi:tRNA pseudouridine38-40 synthase
VRYFLELSYKGTAYHGWQRQKNAPSIQSAIETAQSTLMRHPLEITGCGRTDTGVHARRFFAHFDTDQLLDSSILYPLNALLPDDIAIHRIFQVPDDLHSRYSATCRTYKYFIHFQKDPFLTDTSYWMKRTDLPDISSMNAYCAALPAFKDFSSFEKVGSNNEHSLCDLYSAQWELSNDQLIFTITANRFLRNMVRAIVGSCLMVGTGRASAETLVQQIAQQERIHLLMTAPAHGLHLWDIHYPSLPSSTDESV